ncbi:MAG: OmpA family protein [Aureispira sp.]|nr:OmpA family protein [Aureispira sp.]
MKLSYYLSWLLLFVVVAMQGQDLKQSIYFESAEYQLKTEETEVLDVFLKSLPSNWSAYDFLLVGHTDNIGNAVYNQKLSQSRCKTIKDYLLEKGFDANQIGYEGKGYETPIASNQTSKGKAKNRRVELITLKRGTFSEAPFQVPTELVEFDAEEGLTYTYERSGTVVRIGENALVYADGSPVKGIVDFSYREFRDAADFIATDIPMLYDHQHQFESAGMFEMNASQDGRAVFVKEDAYVDVDFSLTDDNLEGVSFFEYKNEKWSNLGVLDRTTQENTFEVNNRCKSVYRYRMPPIQDTFQTFLNAMNTGYQLSQEAGFEQFYRLGFKTLQERFDDIHYAETKYLHYKVEKIDWNAVAQSDEAMGVQFKYNEDYKQLDPRMHYIKLPEGLLMEFKETNLMQRLPEMQTLIKRTWMVLPKGKQRPLPRVKALQLLENQYMDIRVNYLGDNNFQFILKGIGVYDTLVAQPVFEGQEKKNKAAICESLIEHYNQNFEKRSKRFDEKMAFYESNWKYFLAFSKSIMPIKEQCKGINNWLKHFGKNQHIMEPRYYAYTGLGGNEDVLKPLMTKAVAGTPIRLQDFALTKPTSNLQRLKLNGFGIFNCDALRRLGTERITVETEFLAMDGTVIDAKVINIIDHSINSVFRLKSTNKISYNPKKVTTIVLVDYFGDAYSISAEELERSYKQNNEKLSLNAILIEGENTNAIRGAIAQQ